MEKKSKLIGTDPKYPPVVDHSWLAVDPSQYDNYPSDNNPVRVLPKLSDLWRTNDVNATLIPNVGPQDLCPRTAQEEGQVNNQAVPEIVREAKKSMMAGAVGKEVADHLRTLFTKDQIKAAAEELQAVSSEMGLLGNVYYDVSAFKTYDEADKFLTNHRSRLAGELLFNPDTVSPSVVMNLASKHRKNASTELSYDEETLNRYKNHLVMAGRIPADYEVNTKEDLRKAFLHVPEDKDTRPMHPVFQEKKATDEDLDNALKEILADNQAKSKQAAEDLLIPQIRPIISFIQENLASGKDRSDLKEMLRTKFASTDIQVAAPYIALAVSKEGLSRDLLDAQVEAGGMSENMADELKGIAKMFPVRKTEYEKIGPRASEGVQGYFYSLNSSNKASKFEDLRNTATLALQKGFKPERVLAKLKSKVSAEDAKLIMSEAVSGMNTQTAAANKPRKSNRKMVFEATPKRALPDAADARKDHDELLRMFAGSGELQVDVSQPLDQTPMDIQFGSQDGDALDAGL